MKKLLSLLLIFLCLHASAQKDPFEYNPLKGKVKSVSIKAQNLLPPRDTTRFVMNGRIDRAAFQYPDVIPFRFEYDRNGNLVFQEDFDRFYKTKFNNKNQLTEIAEHIKGNPKKRLVKKTTCEYSGDLLTDSSIYSAFFSEKPAISEQYIYLYDKNKKLRELILKKYELKDTGSIYKSETKTTYKYDAHSKLLEEASYDKSGNLYSTNRYLYDNKGRKIKEIYETNRDRYNTYSNYQYDQQNNLIEVNIYDFGNKLKIKRIIKYNADNLIIERTHYFTNNESLKTLFSYDKKKQLVKTQEFFNGKETYLNEFLLDQKGNVLISMFYLPGGKPLIKHIHQIEYYD